MKLCCAYSLAGIVALTSVLGIASSQLPLSRNLYQRFCSYAQPEGDRDFAQNEDFSDWFSAHFPRDSWLYVEDLEELVDARLRDIFAKRLVESQQLSCSNSGTISEFVFGPVYTLHDIFVARIGADLYREDLEEATAKLMSRSTMMQEGSTFTLSLWRYYLEAIVGRSGYPPFSGIKEVLDGMVDDHHCSWETIVSTKRMASDLKEFVLMQPAALTTDLVALITTFLVGEDGSEQEVSQARAGEYSLFALLEKYPANAVSRACALHKDVFNSAGRKAFLLPRVPTPEQVQEAQKQTSLCYVL